MSLLIAAATELKKETAAAHQQVEDWLIPKLQALTSPQEYVQLLNMFYGFFHPLQTCIGTYITPDVLEDISYRRSAGWILLDLQAMGCQLQHIPECNHLPIINSLPRALGALYVLEGSTLGGRVISKMLQKNKHLQLTEKCLHFFEGYKEETGHRWKTFVAALNRRTEVPQITEAANETFFLLKHWIINSLYYE